MGLKELYNIVVHIDKFKTYDVLDSDFYRLNIKCYYKKKGQKNIEYITPIEIPNKKYSVVKTVTKQPKSINLEDKSFVSQVFIVNLYYQEIELNELCVFQLELDTLPSDNIEFFVEVNLEACASQEKDAKITNLTKVDLKIGRFRKQGHEYIPVIFENFYFGLVSMMVHNYIVDIIHRPICNIKLRDTEHLFSQLTYKTPENYHKRIL